VAATTFSLDFVRFSAGNAALNALRTNMGRNFMPGHTDLLLKKYAMKPGLSAVSCCFSRAFHKSVKTCCVLQMPTLEFVAHPV
jgi:hypothetical protein